MAEAHTDEMRPEYDFSDDAGVVVGKHAAAFGQQTTIVRLDADIAGRFPDAAAVNAALRDHLKQSRSAAG